MEWLTIEVFDGEFAASSWRDRHGDALVQAGVSFGAVYWEWHEHRWGVVLELLFREMQDLGELTAFRELPAVVAALDAVPDRVNGLLVYRGRGGGAGAGVPRRPRPAPVADAAALPEPDPDRTPTSREWVGCATAATDGGLRLAAVC